MSENIKKWYVLRAIGGKEKKVKEYIESEVARLKLESMGIEIETLTKEQEKYLKSWTMGT